MTQAERPLIIQSDRSILVEAHHPLYEEVRDRLAQFAELEKSPEHMHFYRVSQISIWNAATLAVPLDSILEYLETRSRYPVPRALLKEILVPTQRGGGPNPFVAIRGEASRTVTRRRRRRRGPRHRRR